MRHGQNSHEFRYAPFPGVPTAWTYNNLSEILTETVGTGSVAQTTTNTWDTLGDELSTQNASGTTSMGYNLIGQMTSLTDPDQNQTVWTRDNLGRVVSEQNPSGTETFGYDPNSNLVKQVDFDGRERDFVLDDLNRETAEKWISGGTAINTISTAYNADGQVTSTGDDYSEYAFGYNGLTDVETFDNNGVLTKHVHLVYDVYDNLIEEDIDPNGEGTYTTIEQFTLDVVAQPPSAGNAPLEQFDSSGNLVPSVPDDVLLEVVNGALAYRFLNGPSPSGADAIYAEGEVDSLFQPDDTDWIFVNNQGSPTDTADSNGNQIDHEVWSPFGELAYESDSAVYHLQGFSGGTFDPNTGLVKFGERWYDPLATVWIGVDPAGFKAGGFNATRYAGNDAVGRIDPSGMQPQIPAGGRRRGRRTTDRLLEQYWQQPLVDWQGRPRDVPVRHQQPQAESIRRTARSKIY